MQAIDQEGSVTLGAQRLGLSQPAVSNAPARLRVALRDPLFVRSRDGMKATPRARRVVATIDAAMELIRRGLHDSETFEPATTTRSLSVLVSDLGELVFLPRLMQRLRQEAPGLDVLVSQFARAGYVEALEAGLADLAVGYLAAPRSSLRSRRLFSDYFVCMVRQGHPATAGPLTVDSYLAMSHISVARRGGQEGKVTAALSGLGLERRTTLVIPHFAAAPGVVAVSDLAVTVPSRMVPVYAGLGVVGLALPFAMPGVDLSLYWHERSHGDAANRWLRDTLVHLFAEPARAPVRRRTGSARA